jgi:hypothetical protein
MLDKLRSDRGRKGLDAAVPYGGLIWPEERNGTHQGRKILQADLAYIYGGTFLQVIRDPMYSPEKPKFLRMVQNRLFRRNLEIQGK